MTIKANVFTIPAENIEAVYVKIAKMNKVATKLNCEKIEIEVLSTYQKELPMSSIPNDKRTYIRKYIEIEVNGTAPSLDGWTFVAKLDHDYTIPLISSVPNVTVPTVYHNHDSSCDHCNSTRNRKTTYVVQNRDTLEYKHVGKSCLKDFLGHQSPATAIRYFEFLTSLDDELCSFDNSENYVPFYSIDKLLAIAKHISDVYGFMSVKKAREINELGIREVQSTSSDVFMYINNPNFYKDFTEDHGKVTEEHISYTKEVIEHFNNMEVKGDYLYNIKALLSDGCVKNKEFGIIVSMVGVYINHIEKTKNESLIKKTNEWFGEIGKRITAKVTVISIRPFETQYGISYVINMVDDEGRSVVWFASTNKFDIDGTYDVKLTIKSHDEYKDWKQTVVNRVAEVKG